MNILTSSITAICLFATTGVFAQQYQFVATDNSIETKLCIKVGENDKQGVRSIVRRMNEGKVRKVANAFQCNGMSLAKFAYKYEAPITFDYLNRVSLKKNRVNPTVTIQDVAKWNKDTTKAPIIIHVSSEGSRTLNN